MSPSRYKKAIVMVSLERSEEFVAFNDGGLPFFVRQVTFNPGNDTVGLRGFAKKKDGTRGFIERAISVKLEEFVDQFDSGPRIVVEILKHTGSMV